MFLVSIHVGFPLSMHIIYIYIYVCFCLLLYICIYIYIYIFFFAAVDHKLEFNMIEPLGSPKSLLPSLERNRSRHHNVLSGSWD